MIEQATLHMPVSQLLGAIWYTDGSGWHGNGAGIEGTPGEWTVREIRLLLGGIVEIAIQRATE